MIICCSPFCWFQWKTLNQVASDLAREVADEGGALVAGSLSPITAYKEKTEGKEFIQNEFKKQCDIFVEKKVDFLLGEVRFLLLILTKCISYYRVPLFMRIYDNYLPERFPYALIRKCMFRQIVLNLYFCRRLIVLVVCDRRRD